MPPARRILRGPRAPMLAAAGELPPDPERWAFEVKWDGVRAIVAIEQARLRVTSRGGQDLTVAFPELTGLTEAVGDRAVVLDGELIAFDDAGRQRFDAIQRRLRTTGTAIIERLARDHPATFAIFDLLELDGESITAQPWHERRAQLEGLHLDGAHWHVPPAHVGAGAELLAATAHQQLEGIVAKHVDSPYRAGERSDEWRKIKHRARQEVVIGGWSPGTGQRAASLGALQVGVYEPDGTLRRVGGVGSGLRDADLTELRTLLDAREIAASPFVDGDDAPRGTRHVTPDLVCEVVFAGWSAEGSLRHAVFQGLRSDRAAADVTREPANTAPAHAVTFDGSGSEPDAIVGTRTVRVTNLDKPMYEQAPFTKRDVLNYYAEIAPVLLPHLAGRALTLRRFPHGAADPTSFFEKRAPQHRPEWVRTVRMPVGDQETIDFVEASEPATLVWLANLAAIELHPSLSHAADAERPTFLVFDLDPGPPASVVESCRVALLIRDLLSQLGVDVWAKTSGGKGLQLYAPINVEVTYDDTKPFAHAVAALLEDRHPQLVVSRMAKRLRAGKVLIDWSQNDRHKTTVAAYSLRAQPTPTVSTPVTWDEVQDCADVGDPAALRFTATQVLDRVRTYGDLFAPVLTVRQTLPALGG